MALSFWEVARAIEAARDGGDDNDMAAAVVPHSCGRGPVSFVGVCTDDGPNENPSQADYDKGDTPFRP